MRSRSLSLVACASFLLTVVMLTPSRALADSISITQGLVVFPIEGFAGSLFYTVTNTGGNNVALSGLGVGPFLYQMGDPKDVPKFSSLTGTCGIGTILAPGAACTMIVNFTTPNGAHDKDLDTGTSSVNVLVGTMGGASALSKGTVVVTDFPKVAGVPEPSSYLLFCTGLAGMLGVIRRKLRV
jgi:hypothetical protein